MAMKTNPHITLTGEDYLYHLAMKIGHDSHIKQEFHDVKFVCIGGSPKRMLKLAQFMNERLNTGISGAPKNYAVGTDRYCLFKAGPVLIANHGIGTASMSVVLNELFKLLFYAECSDVIFIRLGTCGGIGIKAGTVVISDGAVNGELQPIFSYVKLGRRFNSPVTADLDLVDEVCHQSKNKQNFDIVVGKTCSVDCFYEAQGRIDGALCDYSEHDKKLFIERLQREGVRNVEMESLGLFSYCHRAGFKAVVINVVLVNRVEGDIPSAHDNLFEEWETRPFEVALDFIKSRLRN